MDRFVVVPLGNCIRGFESRPAEGRIVAGSWPIATVVRRQLGARILVDSDERSGIHWAEWTV